MPATGSDELVERLVQDPRIGGSGKGLLTIVAEPDHGLGPSRPVIRIAVRVAPEDGAARIRIPARKGPLDLDVSVADELRDLCIAQGSHRLTRVRYQGLLTKKTHIQRAMASCRTRLCAASV
jgi:hypothetical protein